MGKELAYLSGFGSHFQTEALANTLPVGQNSPQQVAHGLYAEQLSGTAFTAPRNQNQRSWLYRIRPSVLHGEFSKTEQATLTAPPFKQQPIPPTQMRWQPLPLPDDKTNFIQSWHTMAGHGDTSTHTGAAIHLYACNTDMQDCFFYDADGELLIVPETGGLTFHTEMGALTITPGEIIVIPRGIKFRVELNDKTARGYILENHGAPLRLPDLGPIGANGLANPRDLLYPTAAYEEKTGDFTLFAKFDGHLWSADIKHSPLDVVAWHGNYAPYKYDLKNFNTIYTVSYDHTDPSIFTVLTSPTNTPGVANIDFVIFPERWMVAENTFRPPYFHRNVMSEYMGLIYGVYDAKEDGFVPGGSSLHNCMSAHGPDADAFTKASTAELKPIKYKNTLAFMFESYHLWQPTSFALSTSLRQANYLDYWSGLKAQFNP